MFAKVLFFNTKGQSFYFVAKLHYLSVNLINGPYLSLALNLYDVDQLI